MYNIFFDAAIIDIQDNPLLTLYTTLNTYIKDRHNPYIILIKNNRSVQEIFLCHIKK